MSKDDEQILSIKQVVKNKTRALGETMTNTISDIDTTNIEAHTENENENHNDILTLRMNERKRLTLTVRVDD
jgi:hypothetical protein